MPITLNPRYQMVAAPAPMACDAVNNVSAPAWPSAAAPAMPISRVGSARPIVMPIT